MNIFELVEKRVLNPSDEFHRLAAIFNKQFWYYPQRTHVSLKKLFNDSFYLCSCRSSFLSIDDLLKSLKINEDTNFPVSWETLFTYCEILRNVSESALHTTTEAIESLEEKDSELALNMIEYNRVLLKGNLQRKREILSNIASYVEPMKILFKGTDYNSLYNDSRNMVNNLNIRF